MSSKISRHTHYGLSTLAAVLYAVVWLIGSRVHADALVAPVTLPAVEVTAPRLIASAATLDPIVVTASRDRAVEPARYAVLDPVVVEGSRFVATAVAPTVQPAGYTRSMPTVSAEFSRRRGTVLGMVGNWLVSALLK